MNISLESDITALWQDTIDLLIQDHQQEQFIAMLKTCTPCTLDDSTLYVTTSLRGAYTNIVNNKSVVEHYLSQAAFKDMTLTITFTKQGQQTDFQAASSLQEPSQESDTGAFYSKEEKVSQNQSHPAEDRKEASFNPFSSVFSSQELDKWNSQTQSNETIKPRREEPRSLSSDSNKRTILDRRNSNPLVETKTTVETSKLTFDRFVVGEENDFAFEQALRVANDEKGKGNPLFIYGNSGLGKTHLLRSIQNYILENDPSRLCVYKNATAFIDDYTHAMRNKADGAPQILTEAYRDIDVLIIDDVQKLAGKAGTLSFFFDTFNSLRTDGKQIVLAADRTPLELGLGAEGFDERITSRVSAGVVIGIEQPSYEMKVNLITTFCDRIHTEAIQEGLTYLGGTLSEETIHYMAEKSGQSIRVIEGFCNRCVGEQTRYEAKGLNISHQDIDKIAATVWPKETKTITVAKIQQVISSRYAVSHDDLVGQKRSQEIAEARHIAIWLSRNLCDLTLGDIGKHFGGRSHATIKHSIKVVDEWQKDNKQLYDRVFHLQQDITSGKAEQ